MTIVDRLLTKIDERFEKLTERIEKGKQELQAAFDEYGEHLLKERHPVLLQFLGKEKQLYGNAKIIYHQKGFASFCRKAWDNGCSLCRGILDMAYQKKSYGTGWKGTCFF